MLSNIFCNEKLYLDKDTCCDGPPKVNLQQLALFLGFGLM
jgi:hypothetical protein